MKLETLALRASYKSDPVTHSAAVPIYQTTSYTFDDTQHGADLFDLKVEGNIYTRVMNPTGAILEERMTRVGAWRWLPAWLQQPTPSRPLSCS